MSSVLGTEGAENGRHFNFSSRYQGTGARNMPRGEEERWPTVDPYLPRERVEAFLRESRLRVLGMIPWGSNATFLALAQGEALTGLVIYKPRAGETPLWDFPPGTLCLREYAAYRVSEALGWSLVPPTVLRDGPHGFGMVQLFIPADPEETYFTLRGRFVDQFHRLVVFDVITNNADRKAGHVLRDERDHIWAIDHGITFHADHKLRTVIWDFAGQPIPEAILRDVARLLADQDLQAELERLLSPAEVEAFWRRVERVLETRMFPHPGPGRAVPWPLV